MMPTRRCVIAGATAATIWPLIAPAQTKIWHIGILDTANAELNKTNLDTFKNRLRDLGYVEGENLTIIYRSANGHNERLPALISELIASNPDVMVVRGTPEISAMKNATTTIPVVMSAVADPVKAGVATSLSRPGGNITGMSSFVTELEAKRVEYLHEMTPGMKRMAVLGDFGNPVVQMEWEEVQNAVRPLGVEVIRFEVRSAADVIQAFETASREEIQAVRVGIDGTTRPNRRLIIDLAAKHKLPAIYAAREFAEDGGLMSYSPDYAHLYSRAASLVHRILKGEKPADLPIELPSKFELILNVRTAKALGLSIPPALLLRADEVIE